VPLQLSITLKVMHPIRFFKSVLRAAQLIAAAILLCGSSRAEPSFARKYHSDCTLCHTVYPRLNRTGYLFRRLGYRFPEEVRRRLALQSKATVANSTLKLDNESILMGRELFRNYYCTSCHTAENKGGTAGPTLDGINSRRSSQYVTEQIKNPRAHNPASIMPTVRASDEQIGQIVAYLESLPVLGSEKLEHKTNIADYFGMSWSPTINITQASGKINTTDSARDLEIFIAGSLGDHVSMFIDGQPANGTPGFGNYWGTSQGLLNFGNARNSSETRFGQILTLQGAGFGGTDQFFSEAPPLIYFPVNGFAAGRFGRGGSEEYMIADSTTLKVFGVEESDHSRAFGAIWEQLIGSTGLSGVSVEYAGGWNPNLRTGLTGPELHFQRVYVSANKAFQDSRGAELINVISGLTFGDDNQLVGGNPNLRNQNYGWYAELDAMPVYRHVGAYFRYEALRPSNLENGIERTATFGVTVDIMKYARVQLEYERFEFFKPSNFYTIGFRLNY
jgi:mono/diheme cytochrome c family protein